MRRLILIALAAMVATPATAQMTGAPAAGPATAPTVDPARLAEARRIAAKMLPPGTYRTVMNTALAPVLDGMGDTLKALPLRQLAEMGGLDAKDSAALDKIDIEKIMAIYDPHWHERSKLSMQAMFAAMGDFFTTREPELREAYARAYANRFTFVELRDLNAFFATPTGSKYAAQYLTIATDPAIAAQMKAMMPQMMERLPSFVAAAKKATDGLPPPRKLKDLSADERAELAAALGVKVDELKDPKSAI